MESNLADLGTKHLDGGSVQRALEKCHCHVRACRSGVASRAEVPEKTRQHSEGFTVDDAIELDTQSETDMESGQE